MTNETKLEPCRHCGGEVARMSGLNIGMSGSRSVYCDPDLGGCGAQGPSVQFEKGKSPEVAAQAAIAAWNRRPVSGGAADDARTLGRLEAWLRAVHDLGNKYVTADITIFNDTGTVRIRFVDGWTRAELRADGPTLAAAIEASLSGAGAPPGQESNTTTGDSHQGEGYARPTTKTLDTGVRRADSEADALVESARAVGPVATPKTGRQDCGKPASETVDVGEPPVVASSSIALDLLHQLTRPDIEHAYSREEVRDAIAEVEALRRAAPVVASAPQPTRAPCPSCQSVFPDCFSWCEAAPVQEGETKDLEWAAHALSDHILSDPLCANIRFDEKRDHYDNCRTHSAFDPTHWCRDCQLFALSMDIYRILTDPAPVVASAPQPTAGELTEAGVLHEERSRPAARELLREAVANAEALASPAPSERPASGESDDEDEEHDTTPGSCDSCGVDVDDVFLVGGSVYCEQCAWRARQGDPSPAPTCSTCGLMQGDTSPVSRVCSNGFHAPSERQASGESLAAERAACAAAVCQLCADPAGHLVRSAHLDEFRGIYVHEWAADRGRTDCAASRIWRLRAGHTQETKEA